ncbi:MAG: hypothetical protein HXS53_03045 [Theionarchaea archaeon]|nr:hypothetical protein [Theionarchaea archaeon]
MNLAGWNNLYTKCIAEQYEHFSSLSSIFLGYNLNIDLIAHIQEEDMHLLEEASFFSMLRECMITGSAREVIISAEDRAILRSLQFREQTMGGQAGIMANLFSLFPIHEIVLYTPMSEALTPFLSSTGAIRVPDEQCNLIDPHKIRACNDPDYHFILEFKKGMKISGHTVPRDNRFIASCPLSFPDNSCDSLFDREYDYAIISGFHLLEDTTPLSTSKRHVEALNRHTRVHYEYASTRASLRKSLIEYIHGFDSLGVNECELNEILKILGEDPVETIMDIYEGIKKVKKTLHLNRIHFHHLGFYLTVIDSSKSPERTRSALLYAALMAAARAERGNLSSWKDAKVGLQAPLSAEGISKMSELGSQLDYDDFVNSGIYEDHKEYLVFIPARIVEYPVKTVGLGDTISGLSFVGD